jgi:ketosteroid isomerase-like protein
VIPEGYMQSTAATETSTIQTVEQLNEGYIRAVATGDGAWFQEHLSEDFLNSCPDGSVIDKTAFIVQVMRPSGISGLTAGDVNIRMLGSTAIVHAVTRYRQATGEPAAGRYTDIWMLRDGRWACVAAHVTRG